VDRRRLYQQIAENIEELILNGTYSPGSRLPAEQELADQYEVSRNVIREALKSLKEVGLVSIRTGSGTYVCQPTTEPASEALHRFLRHSTDGFTIAHFYEIRRMLEPDSARLAAQRADEDDLRAIRASLESMEAHREDSEAWSHADLDFHLAIAAATHNPLIHSILYPLVDPLRKVIAAGHAHPSGAKAGLEAHKRITAAIEERAPERAHQCMLDHLSDSEQRLSKLGFKPQDQL
jgi:GntR family transcriptional repressor for pyruvate dehydrogenase complex